MSGVPEPLGTAVGPRAMADRDPASNAERPLDTLPRLVATDLDGTLLRSDGTISARTAEVLVELERSGVDVVFVTGRPPESVGTIAEAVGAHGTVICSNGAFVYDLPRETILESHVLGADVIAALAAELRSALPAASFAVQAPLGVLSESHFPLLWPSAPWWRQAEAVETFLDAPMAKLMVQCAVTTPAELVGIVAGVVAGRAEVCHSGVPGLAEISAAGVTKAATLARWCTARGIGPSEVWAFGDMPNDLAMLEWAGTSFAVGSAHPDVVAVADHVTGSNDDDGVAQLLAAALAAARR